MTDHGCSFKQALEELDIANQKKRKIHFTDRNKKTYRGVEHKIVLTAKLNTNKEKQHGNQSPVQSTTNVFKNKWKELLSKAKKDSTAFKIMPTGKSFTKNVYREPSLLLPPYGILFWKKYVRLSTARDNKCLDPV